MLPNNLAAVHGLAMDCAAPQVPGTDAAVTIYADNETNIRIRPQRLARDIARADGGLVGVVGEQSNQYTHWASSVVPPALMPLRPRGSSSPPSRQS
jgi:hypothetical protein